MDGGVNSANQAACSYQLIPQRLPAYLADERGDPRGPGRSVYQHPQTRHPAHTRLPRAHVTRQPPHISPTRHITNANIPCKVQITIHAVSQKSNKGVTRKTLNKEQLQAVSDRSTPTVNLVSFRATRACFLLATEGE